jgi:hypothetical protein
MNQTLLYDLFKPKSYLREFFCYLRKLGSFFQNIFYVFAYFSFSGTNFTLFFSVK